MMDIDYSPRRSGKTTRLIGWLLQDIENRTIITHSAAEKVRVLALVRAIDPNAREDCVVTPSSVLRGRRGSLAIDNLDLILPYLLGRKIDIMTLTAGEK